MSLTQFLNQSLVENSSQAPIQAEDLIVMQSDRNDTSVDLQQNDTQTILDAMRHSNESRAENLIPGLLHAVFGNESENNSKSVVEETVSSEEPVVVVAASEDLDAAKSEESSGLSSSEPTKIPGLLYYLDAVTSESLDDAVKNEEPGAVSSLIAAISRWSIWEKVGLSKSQANTQVQESAAQTFDPKMVARFSQACLDEPSEKNLNALKLYTKTFYEEIDSAFIRDVILTAIKMGCSESPLLVERLRLAAHLITQFYNRMSDPSRLALFHYALTSHSRDVFDILVIIHRSLANPAQISETTLFIKKLIEKLTAQPELFDNFKDHLYWESYYEAARMLRDEPSLPGPSFSFVSLDEAPFMRQMTHCYNMVLSQEPVDPKSLELCVNTARIEGYQRRPL